jgi:imidazole glycerol phosphate synthase subunit HisF
MDEIIEQLKTEAGKQFIAVEFRNGHFHTVKAYDTWNVYLNSEKADLKNQIDYIKFVEENESTDVYEILVTDDEEKAKELGIIDEEGGFI